MKRIARCGPALIALLLTQPADARIGDPADDFPTRDPRPIYATEAPNLFLHNVGRLTLQLTNLGIIGNPYNDNLSAGFDGYEYLSQASLWVGAIGGDGLPHVSASIAGSKRLEFRPSRLGVDTIYRGYEGMLHGNRTSFYSADDDGDGQANEDFLNGKDDDRDGRIDEDFSAISQQMLTCEYRDDTPEARAQVPDHVPLGIKVRQRSMQWSESGWNEFVCVDFDVINDGDQRLRDVYVGLYVDGDIGPRSVPSYFEDDLAGFMRFSRRLVNPFTAEFTRNNEGAPSDCPFQDVSVNVTYMWDVPDDEAGGGHGDAPGYLGCVYLGRDAEVPTGAGQLSTVGWTSSRASYPEGDPRTDEERYDLLSRGTFPRGDARSPGDYRFMVATGPYQLGPGGHANFVTALVLGRNLSEMLSNAAAAQLIYDGQRVNADHDPMTGIDGKEECLRSTLNPPYLQWDDPCDMTDVIVEWTEPTCFWVDNDCNVCTGIAGRESPVRWLGLSIPPDPELNTGPDATRVTNPQTHLYYRNPGRNRLVVLQWDNRSEVRPDPYSGRNNFEGYRIWRVDNWTRPRGLPGPRSSDWKLLAEFRRHPRDGLELRSPLHLRRIEMPDRSEIMEMTPAGPLYQVGRYEWADTAGIVNGKVYYYSVTAFAIDVRQNPRTGDFEETVIGGLPDADENDVVMATWSPGLSCDEIRVVPNPYRGGADWDLEPSDCDAAGTRVAFRNLPPDWENIDIYTLSGDLVFAGGPGESRVVGGCEVADELRRGGTFFWDLISRNGQDVTSGIYLYAIETGGETCRGRFVVIR